MRNERTSPRRIAQTVIVSIIWAAGFCAVAVNLSVVHEFGSFEEVGFAVRSLILSIEGHGRRQPGGNGKLSGSNGK